MNEKLILVFLVALLFSGYALAGNLTFDLAYFERGSLPDQRIEIYNNQLKPIVEAFDLDLSLENIERCAEADFSNSNLRWYDCKNSLQIWMNLEIPRSDLTQMDYSIIRNGEIQNVRSDNVQVGDTIRMTPPQDLPEIKEKSYDWVTQGGTVDTPPIKLLSPIDYTRKKRNFEERMEERYPCGSSWHGRACRKGSVPVFETETTSFPAGHSKYIGPGELPAYIMPISGNKKAGIIVFCGTNDIPPYGSGISCTANGSGGFDCRVKTEGEIILYLPGSLNCAFFIDKIFEENKATEASWFSEELGAYSSINKKFQAVSRDNKAPKAEFDCEIMEGKYLETDALYAYCNASDSSDEDGEISEWIWDNISSNYTNTAYSCENPKENIGVYCVKDYEYKKLLSYSYNNNLSANHSISLKVIDNDGFYHQITKTIALDQARLTEFTAKYLDNTNVKLWAKCEGNVSIDIHQMDKAVNKLKAEIESVQIPCNEYTEIGPLLEPGDYQATATLGGIERKR